MTYLVDEKLRMGDAITMKFGTKTASEYYAGNDFHSKVNILLSKVIFGIIYHRD